MASSLLLTFVMKGDAGFGGSCVALIRAGDARELAGFVAERYKAGTGNTAQAWVCSATNGAEVIEERPDY